MSVHTKWDGLDLDSYRQSTDPEVDQVVEALLSSQDQGAISYNAMLALADKLEKNPELMSVADSHLRTQLNEMPEYLRTYFEPMEAPEWLDKHKLALGSKLWEGNTLITLIALYSASLPACYLMKNGIPALYKSEKLREHQYIFQRIYETGLMLDATMDEGGLRVVEDIGFEQDKLLLQALQNLDRAGKWQRQGQAFVRSAGIEAIAIDEQKVNAEVERLREKPKRYIWGKGYIVAKKVRFLHASMRFMLTHPEQYSSHGNKDKPQSFAEAASHREESWDQQKYGSPINQEDLAYTLLTFGLVIPQALEKMGLLISREEKEAFLHLWRLVGHIMGVHSELLTDNLEEAEALFANIQLRQAGASQEGEILTEALMGFLGDYLPHTPEFAQRLTAVLIISQLGLKNATYLLNETLIKEVNCFWRKPLYALGGGLFKMYLGYRSRFSKRFKHLGWVTSHRLHEASELLIDSWRDGYTRQPFFVPANATTWVRKPGINTAFMAQLKQWRRKLFFGIGTAMALLALAAFSLAAALPSALFWGWTGINYSLVLATGSWLSSIALMQFWLPRIFDARPQVSDTSK